MSPLAPMMGLLAEEKSSDLVRATLMKSGFVIGALNKSEKYSNVTRLRAYLDRGEQHFLQTSVDTQHRLLDNLANQLFEKRPVDLVDVLKGAGWAFVNSKLSQIEETDEPRPPSAHARVLPGTFRIPDLTDEQMQLLRQIVNVHEGGCQEEFLVERSFDGAQLSYPGSQDAISITASDSDFERLTTQDLISLGTNRQGMLRGKPTNNGIKFIANRSEAASSGEDIRTGLTPMGARDPEEPSQSPKYDLFLAPLPKV